MMANLERCSNHHRAPAMHRADEAPDNARSSLLSFTFFPYRSRTHLRMTDSCAIYARISKRMEKPSHFLGFLECFMLIWVLRPSQPKNPARSQTRRRGRLVLSKFLQFLKEYGLHFWYVSIVDGDRRVPAHDQSSKNEVAELTSMLGAILLEYTSAT